MTESEEREDRGQRGGASVEPQAFGVELRRLLTEAHRMAHAFAPEHGLHATDVQALAVILDAGTPATPGLLRERLGLTSGAVTACLDRLERAGHVRRTRSSADRRIVHIEYVPSARSIARSHFRPLAEATERTHDRFSTDELALVLRFLRTLNEQLAQGRDSLT